MLRFPFHLPFCVSKKTSSNELGFRRKLPDVLCQAVMQLASRARSTRETEGVGFEPTVGCPTLDFESSALNRTQPPFLVEIRKRRTPNVEHPTLNATFLDWAFRVGRWTMEVCIPDNPAAAARTRALLQSKKMLQLKACHVWQAYCILYVHTDSHAITCC